MTQGNGWKEFVNAFGKGVKAGDTIAVGDGKIQNNRREATQLRYDVIDIGTLHQRYGNHPSNVYETRVNPRSALQGMPWYVEEKPEKKS